MSGRVSGPALISQSLLWGGFGVQLGELSRLSGVSVASVKFYLREGLLEPGRRIRATTSDYGESHLQRLLLIGVLRNDLKLSVDRVGLVLGALDDSSVDSRTAVQRAARLALLDGDVSLAGLGEEELRNLFGKVSDAFDVDSFARPAADGSPRLSEEAVDVTGSVIQLSMGVQDVCDAWVGNASESRDEALALVVRGACELRECVTLFVLLCVGRVQSDHVA